MSHQLAVTGNHYNMSPAIENLSKSVLIDNNRHTFVPSEIYQEDEKSQYLDFLGLTNDDFIVLADYIKLADMYNVYAVSKDEYEILRNTHENLKIQHASSVLVESLIKDNMERTDIARVYLNIKEQNFDMTVLKGCNLLFNNNFHFKTQEDFLYFLLFTLEQLHLEAESVPVYFMGMIMEDSKLVELTSRYVRDIRFKKEITCEL